jgi:hypothetical protein
MRGTQQKDPTRLEKNSSKGETFPPHRAANSGKSLGNPVVEMATPKRTQQSDQGDEEKQVKSLGEVEPLSRLDEQRNSLDLGRMRRNCCKASRIHKQGVEHG